MFELHKNTITGLVDSEMSQAFDDYREDPSCAGWDRTVRVMLVHQQWRAIQREPFNAHLEDLLTRLYTEVPLAEWGEEIVRTMTGRTIEEVLRDDADA